MDKKDFFEDVNKENKKIPFIELFKTIYGYYFYDVNKNTILEIGKEEYDLGH